MDNNKTKLFGEFPAISTQEWKDKIVEDLKGADYDKKMIWKTSEGFNVKPFYRKEDVDTDKNSLPGVFPYTRGNKNNNNWRIRQDIYVEDVSIANEKAKKMLSEGVDSLCFHIKGDMVSDKLISTLLDGINAQDAEFVKNKRQHRIRCHRQGIIPWQGNKGLSGRYKAHADRDKSHAPDALRHGECSGHV